MDISIFRHLQAMYRPEMYGLSPTAYDPVMQNRLRARLTDALTSRFEDNNTNAALRRAVGEIENFNSGIGILSTHLPLSETATEAFIAYFERETGSQNRDIHLAICFIASVFCEAKTSGSDTIGRSPFADWLLIPLAREMASYETFTNFQQAQEFILGPLLMEMQTQIENARNWNKLAGDEMNSRQLALAKLIADTQSAVDNVGTLTSETQSRLKAAEEVSDGFQAQLTPMIEKTSRAQTDMDAFVTALREKAAHSEAANFWLTRAKLSAFGFWGSAFALLCLLVFVPMYALSHYNNILSFINDIGSAIANGDRPKPSVLSMLRDIKETFNGDQIAKAAPPTPTSAPPGFTQAILATAARLIVIAAPAVMYFWLIRIVVRYNMHALVLMNDARQRATIMDTYIHLHTKSIALKEDRAVMFGAMFRPLPGQPSDVEPPNLVDIYKLKPSSE